MLSSAAIAFLKRLLDAPGPSGFETLAGRSWRSEAQTFAEKVTTDVAGNCLAEVNSGGSPTILIDGHIDEIGVIVQYIDDDGFLYISPIGGWEDRKSTRLNSSHRCTSYAVFCLKKKRATRRLGRYWRPHSM